MNPNSSRIRQAVVPAVCVVVLGVLYIQSQLPRAEVEPIAKRFRFEKMPLPEPVGFTKKQVRQVHPSLQHMAAWISTVGAAVALGDLDGDGLPNDVCHVDPRFDQVVIAPAPGTPDRYEAFVLNPAPLEFDDTMAPTGTLLGDYNEDGRTDVLVYFWGRSPIVYLQRAAPEADADSNSKSELVTSSFVPTELISPYEDWSSCAATHADLDGDGHGDLVVCNYFSDGERCLDPHMDGRDLQMQHTMSRAFNGGKKHFLLWDETVPGTARTGALDVKYRRVEHGLNEEASHGWTLAIGAVDLDGDGLPEIYISNDFGPDRLLHNRSKPGELRFALLEGRRDMTTPRSRTLGRDSFKGMGMDFGDINGDGLFDMYVSNLSCPWAIYESHFVWINTGKTQEMLQGIAPFRDEGESLGLSRSGWAWDCRLGDFDNDSMLEAVQAHGFLKGTINRWPEMQELAASNDQLLSSPRFWPRFKQGVDDLGGSDRNCFFVRSSDGRFYDIASHLGLAGPMVSRGIALADVDGDGRLDFAVGNQWEQSFFFHNTAPNPGAFLGLHLRLPVDFEANDKTTVEPGHPQAAKPSRPAIGAIVTVHLPAGRLLTGYVDGGSGHSGKRAPDIHFGLGTMPPDTLLNVDVRWRGSDGKMRSQTLQATPGWHVVMLGLEQPERDVAHRE